ncbi:hypothetical protein MIND_00896600 [Mycena indigotica]|uniref:Uncharacterized protein n=1 Tax=Mycena indigotica TaxID=2126181 RepID=A0A8H6SHB7_9AGAR|nr:uncharacterized protein MIND_00896600 [Mycena indigotica]KAF7299466.1 hypothetical protein MIND_00896600 [Mycena indigotica]
MPSISISPSPSSPSPSSTTAPSSSTTLIQIVIAAICGVCLLALIMFIIFRRRQNKKQKGPEVQAGEIVARTHPAALMITSADGKGNPRFVHTPGTNMRTAMRKADGSWEFSDSRSPFTPTIIAEPERPSSSYSRSPSPSGVQEMLMPHTAATASPWGPPVTPQTSASKAWRGVYSPAPSIAASTFLPPASAASLYSRNSLISSNESFVDFEQDAASLSSNPFRSPRHSPRASPTPQRPPRSPATSSHTFLEPPPPSTPSRPVESRAAREIRLGYEALDRAREPTASPQPSSSTRRPLPDPTTASLSPAARAKEAESRAARAIRQGYENVDRHSEYAELDEPLPAY